LDDALTLEHKSRDIAVDMPDFHSAMSLCEQSELILCVPAKHAARMAKHYRLVKLTVPVDLAPEAYVLLWINPKDWATRLIVFIQVRRD
jgi:hypothetical protein